MKFLKSILCAVLIFSSASSQATVYNFGTLLAGSYTPSSNFATLDVTGSGSVYNFTLTAKDLNSLFTNGAFIGRLIVDTGICNLGNGDGSAPLHLFLENDCF